MVLQSVKFVSVLLKEKQWRKGWLFRGIFYKDDFKLFLKSKAGVWMTRERKRPKKQVSTMRPTERGRGQDHWI